MSERQHNVTDAYAELAQTGYHLLPGGSDILSTYADEDRTTFMVLVHLPEADYLVHLADVYQYAAWMRQFSKVAPVLDKLLK